jgi:hypothetical protein
VEKKVVRQIDDGAGFKYNSFMDILHPLKGDRQTLNSVERSASIALTRQFEQIAIYRRWLVLLLPLAIAGMLTLAVHYVSASHSAASPATDWGGPLPGDTTMHPADNPHVVNSDLIVPAGVTLTIEPGVELYFAPGTSLIVYGRLLAEGTPTQTILFTRRDEGTYWGAIAVLYSAADNRIAHAVIEYTDRKEGDIPRSYGVTAYSSRITLADSTLRHTRGKDGAGVVADWNSTLYLLRNEIHDIGGDAVHPTGGTVVISGNHIYEARWGGYYYEGIEISKMPPDSPALVVDNHIHDVTDDCLDVNDSWVIIERNRMHHCADKGISLGSGGNIPPGTQSSSATVVNNLVYASEIGIAVKDSTVARLAHNTLADNETGLALYEAHDHPGLGGGHATVVNSILWGNGQSISLDALSSVTVTYADVQGGWSGEGNSDADPLFQAAGDYHLDAGSPAINAARDEGVAVDLDGQPRPVGGTPDMGAYEFQPFINLWAWPGDQRIHLAWQVAADDPALHSFAVSATVRPQGMAVYSSTLITGLPTTTLAYTLTDLINYAWYTVVIEGWDANEDLLARSNAVVVMPTDRYVYLPLLARQ